MDKSLLTELGWWAFAIVGSLVSLVVMVEVHAHLSGEPPDTAETVKSRTIN